MKTYRKAAFLLLLLCSLLLNACSGKEITEISLKGTGLNADTLTLAQGETVTLAAAWKPSDAQASIKWESADAAVASVDGAGVVTGVAVGQTTLTASAGSAKKTIQVEVTAYVSVASIAFSQDTLEVDSGVRKQIDFTVLPENATNRVLRFTVEPADAGVKVSSSGVIEVDSSVEAGSEFIVTATAVREPSVTASMKLIVCSYELEDIKLVDNDFHTELTSITVPLDEPYRVVFAQAVPEKAVPVGEALEIAWSSSDESVCTVNEKGRLSFHKEGNAVITMSSNGFTKEVAVTVTPPSGDFIENYYIPQRYIDAIEPIAAPIENGWHVYADFRNGGTGAEDAKRFVFEKYKYGTGPSSWFAGGGYCVEMGGWDNIHSGLEDDDLSGGGMANLYMWAKVTFGENAQKLRAYFQYRQSDATFKYKLRFTLIDPTTKEVTHLSDWQIGEFKTDSHLVGDESYIECSLPEACQGREMLVLLEYDDIDYPTDGIINGVESVNIKYFSVMNNDGVKAENAMWVIGPSTLTTDFSGAMLEELAQETGHTLFRDTISGRTIAPASGIGIVDCIDNRLYEDGFEPFGTPQVIVIYGGSNDLYWSSQPGNALRLGELDSTDKTQTYGALRYTLDYFTTRYPTARIVFATGHYRTDIETDALTAYIENLHAIVSEYKQVEFLDMYTLTGFNEENAIQYLIDGVHPTKSGVQVLKEILKQCILGS